MANEIEIFRKNTAGIEVTVIDVTTDDVFNLTGYTTQLTVKRNDDDADSESLIGPIAGTTLNPTLGITVFALTGVNTDFPVGSYVYDVKVNDGTSDIKTVESTFKIKNIVTRG